MKKLLTLLFVGAAIIALGASCDKGGGNLPNGIAPVKADAELTAFFEENGQAITQSLFWQEDEFGTPRPLLPVDTCTVINSAEEFGQIDFSHLGVSPDLPYVDFEKYTLVVGQWKPMNSGQYLHRQLLSSDFGMKKMNLIVKTTEGIHQQYAPIQIFWGVYPKFERQTISTERY